MRRNSKLWLPSRGEDRTLNLLFFVLVLVAVALGFEILKFPASIAPDRPPLIQFAIFAVLLALTLGLTWMVARDDYIRFSYGFRRVLASFVLMAALFTAAFLIRGLWDGTFLVDPARPLSWRATATILIGGQFATFAFLATHFIKPADTKAVRDFKKSMQAIRVFARRFEDGKLSDDDFEATYKIVEPEMKAIPESARAIQLLLVADEAKFASDFAGASARAAAVLEFAPTQDKARETVRRDETEALTLLTGRKDSPKAPSAAAA